MASDEDRERLEAWVDVIEDSSYYEVLGVLDLADAAAIQAAFHEFALAFHPDGHEDGTEAERAAARYVFRRGAEAYRVLSDPDLRAKYDLALASGHLRLIGGEPSHRVATSSTRQVIRRSRTRTRCRWRSSSGGSPPPTTGRSSTPRPTWRCWPQAR